MVLYGDWMIDNKAGRESRLESAPARGIAVWRPLLYVEADHIVLWINTYFDKTGISYHEMKRN